MREAEWNDSSVLLALRRGNSVLVVARILCVNASTVSRGLAAPEAALGGTLILRVAASSRSPQRSGRR